MTKDEEKHYRRLVFAKSRNRRALEAQVRDRQNTTVATHYKSTAESHSFC